MCGCGWWDGVEGRKRILGASMSHAVCARIILRLGEIPGPSTANYSPRLFTTLHRSLTGLN